MFFAIFWTAYVPLGIALAWVIGEWLMQSLRQLGARVWPASSNDRAASHPPRLAYAAASARAAGRSHSRLRR
jgi:hypothetical protein